MKKNFNICKFNQDMFPAERIAKRDYWENKKSREYDEKYLAMLDDGYGDYLDAVYTRERDERLLKAEQWTGAGWKARFCFIFEYKTIQNRHIMFVQNDYRFFDILYWLQRQKVIS